MPETNQLTRQIKRLSRIYDVINSLMPKEGIDYNTTITFNNEKVSIVIKGITPLGIAFAKTCEEKLQDTIRNYSGKTNNAESGRTANIGSKRANSPAGQPIDGSTA